jgi:hypothetical protein
MGIPVTSATTTVVRRRNLLAVQQQLYQCNYWDPNLPGWVTNVFSVNFYNATSQISTCIASVYRMLAGSTSLPPDAVFVVLAVPVTPAPTPAPTPRRGTPVPTTTPIPITNSTSVPVWAIIVITVAVILLVLLGGTVGIFMVRRRRQVLQTTNTTTKSVVATAPLAAGMMMADELHSSLIVNGYRDDMACGFPGPMTVKADLFQGVCIVRNPPVVDSGSKE